MAQKRLKRPRDPLQLGKLIVDIATGQAKNSESQSRKRAKPKRRARQSGAKPGKKA